MYVAQITSTTYFWASDPNPNPIHGMVTSKQGRTPTATTMQSDQHEVFTNRTRTHCSSGLRLFTGWVVAY